MAKDRLSLHDQLLSATENVYFQPPATIVLKYPCIIYKLDDIDITRANNSVYSKMEKYLITIVDRNPDTKLYENILDLPYSGFVSAFTKDNLNHYICSLYW